MHSDLAAADTLERAADYMERYGHYRGGTGGIEKNSPACAIKAIFSVDDDECLVADYACNAMNNYVGTRVSDWSDTSPTPVVLAGLRACAALLRARALAVIIEAARECVT